MVDNSSRDFRPGFPQVSNKGKPEFSTTFKALKLMIYRMFRLVFNISTEAL